MLTDDDRREIRQMFEEMSTAKGATMILIDDDVRRQLEALATGIVAITRDLQSMDRRFDAHDRRFDAVDQRLGEHGEILRDIRDHLK